MENWFAITLTIIAIVFVTFLFGWLITKALDVIFDEFSYKKSLDNFRIDLINSVKHSQPDWLEMIEIAKTRELTQSQIQPTLRALVRYIRKGEEIELEDHLPLILTYTESYKKGEPFEDLPSDIRVHLERLRDKLENSILLEPLTNHIKELVAIHSKENKRLKFYTLGGFIVGVIGIALAVILYLSPINTDVKSTSTEDKIGLSNKLAPTG